MKVIILAGSVLAMWLVANYIIPESVWDGLGHSGDNGCAFGFKLVFILFTGVSLFGWIMDKVYGPGPRPPGNDSGME